ncbi:MAG: helix-turn-helix domain-containing protein [Acidimicrobiales bacterium]
MNASELSAQTADPIQLVGMSFYFAPSTAERAKALGLNVFQFYGLGRGGVLGDADYDTVFDAFTFFSHPAMGMLWTASLEHADPVASAAAYLEAAYAYADDTFGAIDRGVLEAFAHAARNVVNAVPAGHHALFDGYAHFEVPTNPVHAAYLGAILLRELRGGVHIDAVHEVEITPEEAAYLHDPSIFKLHGYSDDDVPEVTPELEAKKVRAEELTTSGVAAYLEVLSESEREALLAGALAMQEATKSPVPVSS